MTDQELLDSINTQIASYNSSVSEVRQGDRSVKYRSLKELLEERAYLESKIALANGTMRFTIKASNGGRA